MWAIGSRMRYVRKHRKLSGQAVALRAGLPASTLSEIENGRRNATVATLGRIAVALECSLRDLMPLESSHPITQGPTSADASEDQP